MGGWIVRGDSDGGTKGRGKGQVIRKIITQKNNSTKFDHHSTKVYTNFLRKLPQIVKVSKFFADNHPA
jgi:hypothetical protein